MYIYIHMYICVDVYVYTCTNEFCARWLDARQSRPRWSFVQARSGAYLEVSKCQGPRSTPQIVGFLLQGHPEK